MSYTVHLQTEPTLVQKKSKGLGTATNDYVFLWTSTTTKQTIVNSNNKLFSWINRRLCAKWKWTQQKQFANILFYFWKCLQTFTDITPIQSPQGPSKALCATRRRSSISLFIHTVFSPAIILSQFSGANLVEGSSCSRHASGVLILLPLVNWKCTPGWT